ncbi:MAG: glycerate kinase [Actinobacteria bacterium]|nr:glycerate kinase [Actinomycetota bacterium]
MTPMGAIVVAPAAFKGAVSARAAADALAAGIAIASPHRELRVVPVADGGNGTLDVLLAHGGKRRTVRASDPLGRPIDADWALLPDGTAVVELAQASGFERLRGTERDPERTSTFGTGEIILAAIEAGARRLLVTVGGSATNDAGIGLARALGARLIGSDGRELKGVGGDLVRIARIDRWSLDPRIHATDIEVAVDVTTPLTGPEGAAAVFAPQKGADPPAVARLARGLDHIAGHFRALVGDGIDAPGAGAAGGAAAGLVALLGARIVPGAERILDAIGFARSLAGAALCITGEGSLDAQTLAGKAPSAVASACRVAGIPCVAVCGQLDLLPGLVHRMGLAAAFPIGRSQRSLEEALAATGDDLAAAGASIVGLWEAARRA